MRTALKRPMLGMYVHTHWAYNHPYAGRTWTADDWENYLEALSTLGFTAVKIWPQLDCMPASLTRSDSAYLAGLARMTDTAHSRFGMDVIIVACANTMGNEKAARYEFHNRPYFVCERKINPRDKAEVKTFLEARRVHFQQLSKADALAIIDSDPGGYIGSTNDEFVELMKAQIEIFRSANPSAELIYWMLAGWESYNKFWARVKDDPDLKTNLWGGWQGSDFLPTLKMTRERIAEPWSLLGCLADHVKAVRELGLTEKLACYPYGAIEGEPTFPLTNVAPDGVASALAGYTRTVFPGGIMGNAQTHCMQVPHTCLFAHIAQGGTVATFDMERIAERILPGSGKIVATAWSAIEKRDRTAMAASVASLRNASLRKHARGDLSGLLFGSAERFLVDLAMNLELNVALMDFRQCLDSGGDVAKALPGALSAVRVFQQRTGFADAYGGPLYEDLNRQLERLGDPAIDAVLHLYDNWRDPSIRNGILPRLLDAADNCLSARSGNKR